MTGRTPTPSCWRGTRASVRGRTPTRSCSNEYWFVRATSRCVERALTGRLDASLGDELVEARDVLGAPDAAGPPRREADRVAVLVEAAAHAVDPTEAQRLVDRFRPRDAGLARALLVEAGEELVGGVVVLREPRAELLRRREELRFRRHGLLPTTSYPGAGVPGGLNSPGFASGLATHTSASSPSGSRKNRLRIGPKLVTNPSVAPRAMRRSRIVSNAALDAACSAR